MNEPEKTFEEDKTLPWNVWGNRTVMFLFYDWWFRVAIVVFLALIIFLSLFLPKIWKTTPPDFNPVLKVSGLDKFQAWSLRRSAEKSARNGSLSDAMLSWRSALANDPGDPDIIRGCLRTLIAQPLPAREFLPLGVRQAQWLLRLTKTNTADLILAAELSAKYELHDLVVAQLDAKADTLPPAATAQLLKALFFTERMSRFGGIWERHGAALKDDAEAQLFHAVWLAGWGPPGTSKTGREQLEAARNNPALGPLAHRLSLLLSAYQNDLPEYVASLEELRAGSKDTVTENVNHWRLLALAGRTAEAAKLAQAYATPPRTPYEAQLMTSIFFQLGLKDYSVESLERWLATPELSWSVDLWIQFAQLLIELKRWDDLRSVAVQARAREELREHMGGYGYFLEGLAHYGLNRPDLARESFARAPSLPFNNPALGFSAASTMNRLGFYPAAGELLLTLENAYTNKAEFYHQLVAAAYQNRQLDVLIPAAEKAYELEPDNLEHAQNYAAALLTMRQNPAEAIKLTLRVIADRPRSIAAQINHAQALLQNSRLDDAESILRSVDPDSLSPAARSSCYAAWFELHARRGNGTAARQDRARIDDRHLLPPEIKWIDEAFAKLPPAGTAVSP